MATPADRSGIDGLGAESTRTGAIDMAQIAESSTHHYTVWDYGDKARTRVYYNSVCNSVHIWIGEADPTFADLFEMHLVFDSKLNSDVRHLPRVSKDGFCQSCGHDLHMLV